jgi:hypothetical protein
MTRSVALAFIVLVALVSGCAAARETRSPAYVPDAKATRWADFVDSDGLAPVPVVHSDEPRVALARVESGKIVDPGSVDLEALARSERLGKPQAIVDRPAGELPRLDVADLRRRAGTLGARYLLVARAEGAGRERRLTASLHETATGREIGRYGPGEPSLAIAADALAANTQPN